MTVTDAHSNLVKAEDKVREAETNLEHARNNLDAALAERGWIRLMGAFDAGARLYQFRGGEPQPLDAVLRYEMAATA